MICSFTNREIRRSICTGNPDKTIAYISQRNCLSEMAVLLAVPFRQIPIAKVRLNHFAVLELVVVLTRESRIAVKMP